MELALLTGLLPPLMARLASLVGSNGVIVDLTSCSVMMSIVSTATDFMQVLMCIESVHFNLMKPKKQTLFH
jgi:hypothetical protein